MQSAWIPAQFETPSVTDDARLSSQRLAKRGLSHDLWAWIVGERLPFRMLWRTLDRYGQRLVMRPVHLEWCEWFDKAMLAVSLQAEG